ncbi:TetR/AcrR family transcriptional regulator [Sporosarcina sp. FSL W7-1349]|uniref:TetR/AcrR family transcriptional regulator n=1 Tax=Sporosarcina sp. FSL W7-1349 TaxID=2921561 RepID=UPI0030F6A4AD
MKVNAMMDPKKEMIKMAAELFEKQGYHKCSIQDIVQPLGITKGSFYYYFKNKEELLYYIHDEMITYLIRKTESLVNERQDSQEKLYGIIKALLETIHHYKSNVIVFYKEMAYLSPSHYEEIKIKRDYYHSMILDNTKDEMENGTFRKDLDPEIMTLAILGMCNWAYQWYQPEGRFDVDEIVDIFFRILKDGMFF